MMYALNALATRYTVWVMSMSGVITKSPYATS